MADEPEVFDQWAICELMGHRRVAARVREVQLAGAGFLRLDIPDGQTQYVNPSSVYALHPVSEAVCRAVATHCRPDPVRTWELPAAVPVDVEDRCWCKVDQVDPGCPQHGDDGELEDAAAQDEESGWT